MLMLVWRRDHIVNRAIIRLMIAINVGTLAVLVDGSILFHQEDQELCKGILGDIRFYLVELLFFLLGEVDVLSRTAANHEQILLSSGYSCVEHA